MRLSKISYFTAFALLVTLHICAQNNKMTDFNQSGKCFAFEFDYDEPVSYKIVDCATMQNQSIEVTKDRFVKREQNRLKMIAYQEKLKGLGYDVEATGTPDQKTIRAHALFLKKTKRNAKRRKRLEKRKAFQEN